MLILFMPPSLPPSLPPDPRVQDWPLMQTPWLNLGIVCAYLVVCYVGPRLMAGRKPFDLKPLIVVYNFIMVLMSLYMAVEVRHLV